MSWVCRSVGLHIFLVDLMTCVRIHQVRSVGNNVAVNVWWKHLLNSDISFADCPPHSIDKTLTLDKLALHVDSARSTSDDTQSLRCCHSCLLETERHPLSVIKCAI